MSKIGCLKLVTKIITTLCYSAISQPQFEQKTVKLRSEPLQRGEGENCRKKCEEKRVIHQRQHQARNDVVTL